MLSLCFNISFGAYFLAMAFYAVDLFFKNKIFASLARFFLISGILILSIYIGMRWHIAGRPPFSNMFESLVTFSWAIALASIFIDLKYKIKSIDALASLMSLLALGYASLLDKEIAPLLPALKSNWLTIHVLTCFIGYAALTVSFVSCLVLLFKKKEDTNLDTIGYKMIAFGFLFLTLGIITGAVWANSAWGTYWSWDPKETWSLPGLFMRFTCIRALEKVGEAGRQPGCQC
jgi:ABC-type transport system involved in cytochrome c biogenesis permease subunit